MDAGPYLLVLKCSGDLDKSEIDSVKNIAELHNVQPIVIDKAKGETIAFHTTWRCYSLAYIAGHGNFQSIGESCGPAQSWGALAEELCSAACMAPGAVLFCASCHGGLASAAEAFFDKCPSVENVCGPRGSVCAPTLLLGFHVLMYNLLFRNGGPEQSCSLAQQASGHAFSLHSQQEYRERTSEIKL